MSSPAGPPEPAAAPLVFPCAGCRRTLKTAAAVAGKRVQCPHCGHVGRAPADLPTGRPPLVPPGLLLAAVLAATFLLTLHNLDHTALTEWDESFHAVVARNVLKHPLRPTLVDAPYLEYDYRKWTENHVWLHKPILPFWQVALSFAVLGVNPVALRLPAAVLAAAAAGLTYLIGRDLFDRPPGLLAAAAQAINPFVVSLVHGYQFADNVDLALLFWVEVGAFFLVRAARTGAWRDVLLAGAAQGLAYLSKSHLALLVFGLALTLVLLPAVRLGRRDELRLRPVHLPGLLAATALVAGPWFGFCAAAYPDEFWQEQTQILRHLDTNVENWAAPWDRVVFDYLVAIHGVFYTPALVAGAALLGPAVARRHTGLWLAYAWALGVIVPHLFAVTKTPSATLLALPAFALLLGYLIVAAWRGERGPLAALVAILAVSLLYPAVVRGPGHGYPSSRAFGAIMRQALWVLGHVGGALAVAAVLALAAALLRRRLSSSAGRYTLIVARVFCAGALAWLAFQTVRAAWRVTEYDVNAPASVAVGAFAREHLPENAVLLCVERQKGEHRTTMFYADRTCYPLAWADLDAVAGEVVRAGGLPFVVAYHRPASRESLPQVYAVPPSGRPKIYRWPH